MSTKARRRPGRSGPGSGRPRTPPGRQRPRGSGALKAAAVVALVVVALLVVFTVANRSTGHGNGGGRDAYQVGQPGPGSKAPPIRLPATDGTFDLASPPGQTTLLYFQEGLSCQPCWDQLTDIQGNLARYRALGISRVVSITTDPLGELRRKVTDERLTIPVASDPRLEVSRAYHANDYGMMGHDRDGHSFVVVGPDGVIRWRADYGGAPNYTMYVPSDRLLADLRAGLRK